MNFIESDTPLPSRIEQCLIDAERGLRSEAILSEINPYILSVLHNTDATEGQRYQAYRIRARVHDINDSPSDAVKDLERALALSPDEETGQTLAAELAARHADLIERASRPRGLGKLSVRRVTRPKRFRRMDDSF